MITKELEHYIEAALTEDIGSGDHTSLASIPAGTQGKAKCIIKETGVLAGVQFAEMVFKKVDKSIQFTPYINDGKHVAYGDIPFMVQGSVHTILSCERLVLNVMQRMSGIATMTRKVVDSISSTNCRVFDTRKTTPLNRMMEKWAVIIGGGVNHRFGLYDMILIKDNHIDYSGGIAQALHSTFDYLKNNNLILDVVIETRNLDEVSQVLAIGGVKRILLDNMNPEMLNKAVALINGRCDSEASGGITPENALSYAQSGVDFISMGALTHSVKCLDISLKATKL